MPMYRIKQLQESKGDLHQVIPPLVNKYGQSKSAQMLGICSATINRWLKENGYRKKIVYFKKEAE